MREFDELIAKLEIVRDGVWAKNKEQALEAVTGFSLSFLDVFGHSKDFVSQMSPHLEQIKNFIQSEDFDEANLVILAMLAWLRMTREQLEK